MAKAESFYADDLINFARIYPRFENAVQLLTWLSHNDLLNQDRIKGMSTSLEEIAIQYSCPSSRGTTFNFLKGIVTELSESNAKTSNSSLPSGE
jgi:hypothetical protein